ncbi:MAG: L-threonylcarbamoyladenylate synthase, partial [Burkholderiales bacterium]
MAQLFTVHSENPQPRLIRQAAEIVRRGGVMVYPTDSCYALGCRLGDKAAMERIRAIRNVDERHHLTLVCRDLAEIGQYARVDNVQFRLLKAATPGSYTFILQATKEVPKRLLHPSRRTIGLRVPDHKVAQALLAELGEPVLSSTLLLPGDDEPLNDADQIRDRLERRVDLVLDAGSCGILPTTVVDLTGDAPVITRVGKGSVE